MNTNVPRLPLLPQTPDGDPSKLPSLHLTGWAAVASTPSACSVVKPSQGHTNCSAMGASRPKQLHQQKLNDSKLRALCPTRRLSAWWACRSTPGGGAIVFTGGLLSLAPTSDRVQCVFVQLTLAVRTMNRLLTGLDKCRCVQVWAEGATSPAESPRPSRARASVVFGSQSPGVRSNNPHLVTWQKTAECISLI